MIYKTRGPRDLQDHGVQDHGVPHNMRQSWLQESLQGQDRDGCARPLEPTRAQHRVLQGAWRFGGTVERLGLDLDGRAGYHQHQEAGQPSFADTAFADARPAARRPHSEDASGDGGDVSGGASGGRDLGFACSSRCFSSLGKVGVRGGDHGLHFGDGHCPPAARHRRDDAGHVGPRPAHLPLDEAQ